MYVRDTQQNVADLRDSLFDLHGLVADLHDTLNPSYDAELNDVPDSVEIADSHVQNDELQDRVARLKEEIALTQIRIKNTPKHTPYITPLHPDVYNLPHESIPDTSHTIEYVK